MSLISFSEMPQNQKDQLACTLAALMLHDNGSDVNVESLNRVLKAAEYNVADYWPMLFSRALEGKNVGDFLVSSGGAGGAGGEVEETKAAVEEEEESEEEVEEEEMDFDMGGLFG